MRFQKPRLLEAHETADSLEHWKNEFEVYLTRDDKMSPFLTLTWDASAVNMGLRAQGDTTPAEMAARCKLFLGHVCSFFKYPYYNKKIKERSTSVQSIYNILEEIYNVEKTAESFLTLGKVTKASSESFSVFYAKILYLVEQNLAPANITVDNVETGAHGDKLTVTMMDMAAMMWLMKTEPRLLDKIECKSRPARG